MKINIDDISYIAKLAKLKFTEEEEMDFAREFETVFNHFQNIDKENLSDIDIYDYENIQGVLRKDEAKVFVSKEKLYTSVEQKQEDYIRIPKVIE